MTVRTRQRGFVPTDDHRGTVRRGSRGGTHGAGRSLSEVATVWDARYAKEGYAYGTAPNTFLTSVAHHLPPGRILSLGEGEGRNATFLATRGWMVHCVDASAVGLEKARRLAARVHATISTEVADLAEYAIAGGAWDGIVSIFCHLPRAPRRRLHRQIAAGLRPEGVLILEGYTPRQLAHGTGGPPIADLLVSLDELRVELGGLDFVIAQEVERDVLEGRLHVGRSAVVQLVARKPSQTASA